MTPLPLPACDAAATVAGPLPHGVSLGSYGYDPGPLLPRAERTHLFLEGSPLWTTLKLGTSTTDPRPTPFANGSVFSASRGLTGASVITFQRAGKVIALTYDGTNFGPAVETPCTNSGATSCEARAAGDGHLWVRTNDVFHEQVGSTFASRGGGPAKPSLWDVDDAGNVIVFANGGTQAQPPYDLMTAWKLAPGANGWTKTGALPESAVPAGFAFGGNGLGAVARDGSIHLFSDARCVGTCVGPNQKNKTQWYVRSTDGGATWQSEELPVDALTGGFVTWRNVAFWAGDKDHVRWIVTSSPQPTYDGYQYGYPDRRYDVMSRCKDATGKLGFVRLARVMLPGWTERGYTAFSETGVATAITTTAVTQVR